MKSKKAVIIGGGPAGLTAAYELLDKTEIKPIVYEQEHLLGGISKTIAYKGNLMDTGPHRFFSKQDRVMNWWQKMLPLKKTGETLAGEDKKQMLVVHRITRIFYLRKFFDYPIALKWETFANMGVWRTLKAGLGYFFTWVYKRPENSLENFYINRFGKPLYKMFFEDYTEKVWGVHPSALGADWGAQRVKGLSVMAILKDMLKKSLTKSSPINQKEVETSLIEQFIYPRLGAGQMWNTVAEAIEEKSGEVVKEARVKEIKLKDHRVTSVVVERAGQETETTCDYLLSSMPIRELVAAFSGEEVPSPVKQIAGELPYRDLICVGLLVKKLELKNTTAFHTPQDIIPDNWIYIQEREVRLGRLQIFNNWSPDMLQDSDHTVWLGLEYFCIEGDAMWEMDDRAFIDYATEELEKIHIVRRENVLDGVRVKVRKAYPSYLGSYYQLDQVKAYLDSIENLYCIGRNGQHRYNNMDHSMLSAMVAVENIKNGRKDKTNIWSVNTEEAYHETK